MLNEGVDNGSRIEARRSLREARVQARLVLAGGVGFGILVLFVDWRISIVPVLIGLAMYYAIRSGAPQEGEYNPLIFAIDQGGIQLGETIPIPWNAIAAKRFRAKRLAHVGLIL